MLIDCKYPTSEDVYRPAAAEEGTIYPKAGLHRLHYQLVTSAQPRKTAMIYVTRKASFSAAHRLYNPTFSDERNEAVFDKCNNPLGHGHNYVLEVTVKGLPDPLTGYVIDLKRLKDVLDETVVDKVDHKHLNYDVDFLRGIIPTVENLCVAFWRQLEHRLPSGELHCIKVYESDQNMAEYFGDPVSIPTYDMVPATSSQEVTA